MSLSDLFLSASVFENLGQPLFLLSGDVSASVDLTDKSGLERSESGLSDPVFHSNVSRHVEQSEEERRNDVETSPDK